MHILADQIAFNGADIDVAISSRASAVALTLHDADIKALIAGLNDLSDAEVWTYTSRTLTAHAFPFTNPASPINLGNVRVELQSDTLNIIRDAILSDATRFKGADVATILSAIQNATYGLSALNIDLDKLLTGIIQGTGTVLPSNKSLYDILWVDRSTDSSGSFTFPSGSTAEKDIYTDLSGPSFLGTTRRKYMVYLDMSGPGGDGAAWTTCTIRIYVKIDGTNFRCIDKASKSKSDFQTATNEQGVPIEVPLVAQDVKITIQFDVALTASQTIYYHVAQEKLEH